jgi:hypothetical protein
MMAAVDGTRWLALLSCHGSLTDGQGTRWYCPVESYCRMAAVDRGVELNYYYVTLYIRFILEIIVPCFSSLHLRLRPLQLGDEGDQISLRVIPITRTLDCVVACARSRRTATELLHGQTL